MSFSVNLYTFSKKENSTARPTGSSREFACIIKTGSGILRPVISLDIGRTESPAKYNYAYIPTFNRYYFIEEWYFENALWSAQLSVDVLATYKTAIGSSSLYVLRAADQYDGRIVDNLYPTKVNSTFQSTTINTPWENSADGLYIIGAVGKQSVFGSVNYFALTRSQLQTLMSQLLDNTVTSANGFNFSEASQALQLAIVDPLQYIKSAIFLPVSDAGGISSPGMTIFNYPILVQSKLIVNPAITYTWTMATKKHPQTAARGNYVNTGPYTKATLMFPPFGVIDLDTTVLCNVSEITITVRLDIPTGLGILEIYANNILLNKVESQIGVPIQLAQVTRDYVGAISSTIGAIGSAAGAVASGLTGNVAGAVSGGIGAASGIGNAAMSLIPRANTMGSGGSYAQLLENPRLDFQFFECVDDDIAQNGRPLCQVKRIDTLSGYMLIQDGDVPTTGTAEENRSIRSYLEGGFYYE